MPDSEVQQDDDQDLMAPATARTDAAQIQIAIESLHISKPDPLPCSGAAADCSVPSPWTIQASCE